MRFPFKKKLREEKGIALIMVIGVIVMLTMVAVEFAYNGMVEYFLALRNKQRLQAYYLAQSGYQLALLEMKAGGEIQKQMESLLAQLPEEVRSAVPTDFSAPLCQMFPIQTGMFRMVAGGGEEGVDASEAEETASGSAGLAGLPLEGVEEFLRFEGDFSGECGDESSRINLNFFHGADPKKEVLSGENAYDAHKKLILQTLSQFSLKKYFERSEFTVAEIVDNIADWVDANGNINRIGGQEGGPEENVYAEAERGAMKAKNGKFSVPADIFLVAGVQDRWWSQVRDYFTIYGESGAKGESKVNVCNAPDGVVKGLILRYIDLRKEVPPIIEGEEEILAQLTEAVRGGCSGGKPDKNAIAQALDEAIVAVFQLGAPLSPQGGEGAAGGEAGAKPEGEAPKANSSRFADWIAEDSRFYRFRSEGMAGEAAVRIEAVLDRGDPGGTDTKKWKLVYWKVY